MTDDHGDVFNRDVFSPMSQERASVTFWHIGDKTFVPYGVTLDPHIKIIESHTETIGNDVITVIDRFEIVEVSIIP